MNTVPEDFLFVNRGPDSKGKTRWDEIALAAEVGFSDDGRARSGMGVDAADLDGDGWQDLFVANVDQEMFSLYKNMKRMRPLPRRGFFPRTRWRRLPACSAAGV